MRIRDMENMQHPDQPPFQTLRENQALGKLHPDALSPINKNPLDTSTDIFSKEKPIRDKINKIHGSFVNKSISRISNNLARRIQPPSSFEPKAPTNPSAKTQTVSQAFFKKALNETRLNKIKKTSHA